MFFIFYWKGVIVPKIRLIRHAKTEANIKKQFCGSLETKVIESESDIRNKILSKISLEDLGIIYSSPSKRAIFTANSITPNIIINDYFKEIDFGLFEGMTYNQIESDFPDEIIKWTSDNMKYNFPKGESIISFYERCAKGIDYLIKKHKEDKCITVFTHGGVIQAVLAYLLGNNINLFWQFKIDNCSLTGIDFSENMAIVEFINK